MSSDICIIGVYFGCFDNYFSLWIDSAIKNPTIDFLIITDQTSVVSIDNIKVINISFNELKQRIENKLGMSVSLKKPYKLCDFKPAYGFIFSDYIQNYEYWGHCDFDLIWGDLRYFFEKYDYKEYDRFLDRGHLTLYRNKDRINRLFMTKLKGEVDYRTIFTSEHAFLFDEGRILENICKHENVKFFQKRISADIDVVYKRFRHAFEDTALTKNYPYQIFYYENGHLFMAFIINNKVCKNEYPYIHLQKRKNLVVSVSDINNYYITNRGFFDKNSSIICQDTVQQYNPFPGAQFEEDERKMYDKSMWKGNLKIWMAKNPVGKLLVNTYDKIKYKIT